VSLPENQAPPRLRRGTLLAEFEKKGRAARGLALDGNEARILSLPTTAHGKPVAGGVIAKIRRAGEFWRDSEKALAQIHLALTGLPKIDEADAYRLFLAGMALEKGISPSDVIDVSFSASAKDYIRRFMKVAEQAKRKLNHSHRVVYLSENSRTK
jgi:hypothetical protein